MRDTAKVFARLVEFESRAAALYLGFAHRFTDNKDLSWFWLAMSMEERQHAQFLEFCGAERLLAAGLPEDSEVQALAELLSNLEERAGKEKLSADDAFLIAAELEGSEINDVFAGVVQPVVGTLHLMRKKIEVLIPNHMQTLIEGARQLGASAQTLARMAAVKRREPPSTG